MVNLQMIYEKVSIDNNASQQRLERMLRRYNSYYSKSKYNDPSEEAKPVKQISLKDNYFYVFCTQHLDMVGIERIIEEFANDTRHGRSRRHWNRINPRQYQQILSKFVKDGDMATTPLSTIEEQLDKMCQCALDLIAFETIMHLLLENIEDKYIQDALWYDDYNLEQIVQIFKDAFDDDRIGIDNIDEYGDMLEQWAAFADYKCTSDYGPLYIMSLIGNLECNPSISDAVVTLNRCIDIVHASNELALAFIDGGKTSLDTIRYGNGVVKTSTDDISGQEIDNQVLQKLLLRLRSQLMYGEEYGNSIDLRYAMTTMLNIVKEDNPNIVKDYELNKKSIKNVVNRTSKEILTQIHDIMREDDIEYTSTEVKYILYNIYYLCNRSY